LRLRWLALASLVVPVVVLAGDGPDVTMKGVLSGDGVRFGPATGSATTIAQTVQVKGDRVRIDFAANGREGAVFRQGEKAWLVSLEQRVAFALPASPAGRMWVVNPQEPCRAAGFPCAATGQQKKIAGVRAKELRFHDAGTHGPDGTDRGSLWIDADSGAVLSFDAQDVSHRQHDWLASSVSYSPLPDATFVIPQGVHAVPGRKPDKH